MRLHKGPVPTEAVSEILAKGLKNFNCGAHSLYIDQVKRDNAGERFIRAVEYSAYEEMVIKEANNINKTILSEYDSIKSLEIVHSTGMVKAGEICMVVMVSAENHGYAARACLKAVDLIKEKLPVLKKILYDDLPDASSMSG
jgi:molybdopterin synthase catalytic subunit